MFKNNMNITFSENLATRQFFQAVIYQFPLSTLPKHVYQTSCIIATYLIIDVVYIIQINKNLPKGIISFKKRNIFKKSRFQFKELFVKS